MPASCGCVHDALHGSSDELEPWNDSIVPPRPHHAAENGVERDRRVLVGACVAPGERHAIVNAHDPVADEAGARPGAYHVAPADRPASDDRLDEQPVSVRIGRLHTRPFEEDPGAVSRHAGSEDSFEPPERAHLTTVPTPPRAACQVLSGAPAGKRFGGGATGSPRAQAPGDTPPGR